MAKAERSEAERGRTTTLGKTPVSLPLLHHHNGSVPFPRLLGTDTSGDNRYAQSRQTHLVTLPRTPATPELPKWQGGDQGL